MVRFIIAALLSVSALVFGQDSNAVMDTLVSGKKDATMEKLQELEKKVAELEKFRQEQELKALRQEARASIDKQETDSLDLSKTYTGGQASQQALNPEISITGDFFMKGRFASPPSEGGNRTGQFFRVAGLHIQSDLDPFSKTFFAMEFKPDEIELGEAFVDWNGLVPSLTIRAGKFLQNFGVINRWHMPAMDQFDNPLAPSMLLGGKINQIGLSLHWVMPALWASSNELILEGTNAQNSHLFAGEAFDIIPCGLARLINYYDLGKSAYLNLGFSGIVGQNNIFHDDDETRELRKPTYAAGADLTVLFEPASKAHYRSLLWRSEWYYVNKEQQDGIHLEGLGLYSYLEGRLSRRLYLGARFDYTQPLEEDNEDQYLWQTVPYITFMQSPWVKLRLQYNYLDGSGKEQGEHTVYFQCIWSAGPHKHERY